MAEPAPDELWDEEPAGEMVPLVVVSPRRPRIARSPARTVPTWVVTLALLVVTVVAAMAAYLLLRASP